MAQPQLQELLLAARAALKAAQPKRALELAAAALKLDPANALAMFVSGQAHGALGAAAAAAAAFRSVARRTASAAPGTPAHQLHVAAADNLLLECDAALPPDWIAALHDAPRLATLQAAITAAVQQAAAAAPTNGSSSGARVLVCGGIGVEAALAAQAGAASVTAYCEGNPLTAALTAELAADSGCGGRVAIATCADQLGAAGEQQLQQQQPFNVVILADALGSSLDWPLLRRQLAAAAPLLAPGAALLPHAVHVRGQLVQCAQAVALNEVDVPLLEADTAGLDLAAANRLLPRARRSVRLPAYGYTPLSSASTLASVPLASLLPAAASGNGGPATAAAGEASLAVGTAGSADALCFWFEQQLLGGGAGGEQQGGLVLSSDPASGEADEAGLRPHVWQHMQYLDRRSLAPGQAAAVRCELSGGGANVGGGAAEAATDGLQSLSLGSGGQSSGHSTTGSALTLQLQVTLQGPSGSSGGSSSLLLPVSAEQAAVAAAVPRYHTSMLNDSIRTAAYRSGIAATMRQAEAAATAAAAAAGQPAEAPLVLEIGSGSGLLCLLACQAGARRVIGCERLPELQHAAAQLLAANGLADRVAILPKHSKALTVAPPAPAGSGAAGDAGAAGADEAVQVADLPGRAAVVMHEIFGSDPFSEGVVPTLAHAKQHLLRPDALLAPCRLRVVAAVAASPRLHRLLRPPASACGGVVVLRALHDLAPRKVDCQAGEAASLALFTEPATVLTVDFGAPELPLADSATVLLDCLPRPRPLAAWIEAAQQAAAAAATARTGTSSGDPSCGSTQLAGATATAQQPQEQTLQLEGAGLYAVSWFEYEFPGGCTGSTAPQVQRTEHWQQVVQPLEGPEAEAALELLLQGGGGSAAASPSSSGSLAGVLLTAGYRVDRLWFELEGLAVAGGEEGDGCEA